MSLVEICNKRWRLGDKEKEVIGIELCKRFEDSFQILKG